jgi:hypothetical protein
MEEVAVKVLLVCARADRACRRTAKERKWYIMVVCKKVLHAIDGGGYGATFERFCERVLLFGWPCWCTRHI